MYTAACTISAGNAGGVGGAGVGDGGDAGGDAGIGGSGSGGGGAGQPLLSEYSSLSHVPSFGVAGTPGPDFIVSTQLDADVTLWLWHVYPSLRLRL